MALLWALGLAPGFAGRAGAQPVITGVTAAQQPLPSKQVLIVYTISDPNHTSANISIQVSKDSGATWTVPASTFLAVPLGTLAYSYGPNVPVTPTPTPHGFIWDAGADWDGHYSAHCRVRVLADNTGLATIPAGTFSMGDALDGEIDAPVHSVTISSPLKMDSTLVTGGKWNLVVDNYAQGNGYDISEAQQGTGSGPAYKAANHPVYQVAWYDAVKWCNARSQFEGLTPCYYTDNGTFANIYQSGAVDAIYVNPAANGYRLPTEAEWEYAARGGLSGNRFPWSVTNIDWSHANYQAHAHMNPNILNGYYCFFGSPFAAIDGLGIPIYDFQTFDGHQPGSSCAECIANQYATSTCTDATSYDQSYVTGAVPYTSPVGALPANGYNLTDMAGNVNEWCWDWYSASYYTPGQTDPQGPATGSDRVWRGGSWFGDASHARCAYRGSGEASTADRFVGFRCVRQLP